MVRQQYIGIAEQTKASVHRLDDAYALYKAARWRGAMYIAGYAVECLIKSKLMQIYHCRHLRELEDELQQRGLLAVDATVFTHHLEALLELTQSTHRLRQHRELWSAFNMVNRWVPAWRYTATVTTEEDAQDFLSAVEQVRSWIDNNL